MTNLQHMFEGNELQQYISSQMVSEGAVGDFFKKTFTYLKNKIVQAGDYFVAFLNDRPLQAVLPIDSQIAWMKGHFTDAKAVYMLGAGEDKKFSKISTSAAGVLARRPKTLDIWKKEASSFREGIEPIKELDQIIEEIHLNNDDNEFALLNVDADELKSEIRIVIKNPTKSQPLLIWGAPGIGKTAIVNQVLHEIGGNKRLIDIQLSLKEYDDFFLPTFENSVSSTLKSFFSWLAGGKKGDINFSKTETTKAIDVPKSWLPVYKVTGDPELDAAADKECGEGVIFFDELTRAKPQVMNVCLKLMGERKLGEDYKIGSGWAIIAASNREEDDTDTNNVLGTALGNRFNQINYAPTYKSWKKWAETKGYMNKDILGWLENNQEYFYKHATEDSKLFASPRTWEFACKNLALLADTADNEGVDLLSLPQNVVLRQLAKAVGSTAALAFGEFLTLKRSIDPTKLEYAWTDPDKCPVPEKNGGSYKPDMVYIITTMILNLRSKKMPTPEEFNNACKYFAKLKDESACAAFLHEICDMHPKLNQEFGQGLGDAYVEGIATLETAYPKLAQDGIYGNMAR